MARRRHLSRIAVVQVLFERERRSGLDTESALERNISELGDVDKKFAVELLSGVLEHEKDLTETIIRHAPDWTLERMDPIARCALFIGALELEYTKEAPAAVVINEGIEIAKEFGTDESGKFVNGVLNAIAHKADGQTEAKGAGKGR